MPATDRGTSRLLRHLRERRVRRAFSAPVRRRLWRKLSVQVHNALPVYTAFEQYRRQAVRDRSPLRHLYDRVLRCRDGGLPLATAFRGFASSEEIMLLEAGEHSGDLEGGFALAAAVLGDRDTLVRTVRSGLAYPVFLILVGLAMLVMVSRLIIPQLALVLDPGQWAGAAGVLRDLAGFVNSRAGLAFFGSLPLAAALMAWSFPRWTGRLRRAVDDIGPWGIYKVMAGSAWLLSVATLMRSGLPLRQVFEHTLRDPQTGAWLAERVRAVAVQYSWGKNLGRALHDAGYAFPSREACDDMLAYAQLPSMEEHLLDIAREQMADALETIRLRMRRLNCALLFLVFGLVLLTVYGVFSFQQQFAATM